MQLIEHSEWRIGSPGNGDAAVWQCPADCKFWSDGEFALPAGTNIHLRFGTGAMNHPQGVNGFHNSRDARLYADKIEVTRGLSHDGVWKNLLRLTGETPATRGQSAMLNRKFDTAAKWSAGGKVRLVTHFMPQTFGYPNGPDALAHLRCNVELRGDNVGDTLPQILSVFLGVQSFVQYWSSAQIEPYVDRRIVERVEFPDFHLRLNKWHRLVMALIGTENENEWRAHVRVDCAGETLLDWFSPDSKPVRGAVSVFAYALGDERHGDGWGGRFLWEPLIVTAQEDENA